MTVTWQKLAFADNVVSGWIPFPATWTYASADAPTFTFTIPGDQTGLLSPGMRIRLTQTTVKYFIITAVSYSSPDTTVTVYGGTDYTLVSAAITAPYFSSVKAPFGFPLSPSKWTVEVKDTNLLEQSDPVDGTWYNLGTITISIPIGIWNVVYESSVGFLGAADITIIGGYVTLSTSNNSETDLEFTTAMYGALTIIGSGAQLGCQQKSQLRKSLTLAAKTTYYLNCKSFDFGSLIQIIGPVAPTFLRAICAYL